MGKNFVLSAGEFRKLPVKLKKILKDTKHLNADLRAIIMEAFLGVAVAADEITYKFDQLLGIIKARARVYCPSCQKRVFLKYLLGKKIKEIKKCPLCKGIGSLTGVEIEAMKEKIKRGDGSQK